MILLNEFDVLVIIGGWNKNIFSVEWVSRYLLPNEKLEVEIPLNVDGSPRISSRRVRIAVLRNRLHFTSLISDDSIYEYIQNLSQKTADYLPHTPVSGFGVNFLFQSNITDSLQKVLKLIDNDNLEKLGAKIRTTSIRRELELDSKMVNFSISTEDEKLTFNFNFHFNISNLVEFKEKISLNPIVELRKVASDLLANIYGNEFSIAEGA